MATSVPFKLQKVQLIHKIAQQNWIGEESNANLTRISVQSSLPLFCFDAHKSRTSRQVGAVNISADCAGKQNAPKKLQNLQLSNIYPSQDTEPDEDDEKDGKDKDGKKKKKDKDKDKDDKKDGDKKEGEEKEGDGEEKKDDKKEKKK